MAQVLKAEMRRLGRSEVLKEFLPLRDQVLELKEQLRGQRKRIEELEKRLKQARSPARTPKLKAVKEEAADKARLSPASIKRHRLRLKLSQRELGVLLAVSTQAVVQWEAGRSAPRPLYRARLVQLRQMGQREVRRLLEEG
ncbi:MAG: helix-turn-helix domain-containing protein [Candidatus Latescibacteria bacterium]|nr:helix-turn-helix domain-containing protein [Candidatus Latescibacterota bacterium]